MVMMFINNVICAIPNKNWYIIYHINHFWNNVYILNYYPYEMRIEFVTACECNIMFYLYILRTIFKISFFVVSFQLKIITTRGRNIYAPDTQHYVLWTKHIYRLYYIHVRCNVMSTLFFSFHNTFKDGRGLYGTTTV